MRDEPRGERLLATAEALLRDQLLPALPAEQRQNGLMIARAMAIAARQLRSGEDEERRELAALAELLPERAATTAADGAALRQALLEANRELGRLIRSGQADAGEQRQRVLRHLQQVARGKLAESNPRYLKDRAP